MNNLGNEFLKNTFEIRDLSHYWHLQTKSFAQHKALNELYDSIVDLLDNFAEAYIGVHGRMKGGFTIEVVDYEDGSDITNFLKSKLSFFKKTKLNSQIKNDSDLQNILDEIIGLLNKIVYLLTLN